MQFSRLVAIANHDRGLSPPSPQPAQSVRSRRVDKIRMGIGAVWWLDALSAWISRRLRGSRSFQNLCENVVSPLLDILVQGRMLHDVDVTRQSSQLPLQIAEPAPRMPSWPFGRIQRVDCAVCWQCFFRCKETAWGDAILHVPRSRVVTEGGPPDQM
jgi:hypothetical protein